MVQYHLKKIIFGAVFICLGFSVLFSALYFFGDEISLLNITKQDNVEQTGHRRDSDVGAVQTQSSPASSVQAATAVQTDKMIAVANSVKTSKKVYDETEKARKEGLMWVDREESKYFVTLGAIHGLKVGDFLTVYDGSQRVGRVEVESVFDVISYVLPFKNTDNFYQKNYYQIFIE
ncbi:MAG: hypothetical protein K8S27_11175 [Candidatus Omnitrophica bacterium]|nr:hypothetical protein [Candidatus Omnitrophota bacterium]